MKRKIWWKDNHAPVWTLHHLENQRLSTDEQFLNTETTFHMLGKDHQDATQKHFEQVWKIRAILSVHHSAKGASCNQRIGMQSGK